MKEAKTKFVSQSSPIHLAQMLAFFLGRPGIQWTMLTGLAVLAGGPPPIQAAAAVTEAWTHHFSNVLSNSVDYPSRVVRDSAGDIIVTGTSDNKTSGPDIFTIKYSGVDGSMLWQRRQRYRSVGDPFYSQWFLPVAIAVDASGNVVVSGAIESHENEDEREYYTAKYAGATGAVLWEKRNSGGDTVAVDRAGDVVVTGRSGMLKYAAADGVLLWENNAYTDNQAAAVDSKGNVVVTGGIYTADYYDYHTAKYSAADGGLLWEKTYNGSANGADRPSAVAVDANDNVIVTGYSQNNAGENYYTIKYAAGDGAVMWERQGGSGNEPTYEHARALAVDANGNVVVTGESYSEQSKQSEYDYHTVKYAATDGALLWEKRYDGPANLSRDFAQALALDANGNVVVTGFSTSITNSDPAELRPFDIYTAKYAARDGTLLWERRYENKAHFPWNSPSQSAAGAAVVVDESGNAIVTGPSFVHGIPFQDKPDYYTAKYAAIDGALLWENTYNGPAVHHESYPDAVTMDSSGNVVITATSDDDSYIAKYGASNGALLWEKLTPDQLTQIVVDASGSVFVRGIPFYHPQYTAKYTPDGSLSWKRDEREGEGSALIALDPLGNLVVANGVATATYASSSGDLLWKKEYNALDEARAIAVDNRGNVAVTGRFTRFTSNNSVRYGNYTARYAAMNGALLWEDRSIGLGFIDDDNVGHAVAVDSSGNVIVITSNATLKYAAVGGALLWEKRDTNIGALALDGGGNVVITGYLLGTLKLAGADGAVLWQKPFGTGYSYRTPLSIDGSGNVVVTGQSQDSLYAVKYAAADGGLLWEKRYKEPGSFGHSAGGPHSLALGPNGMVAIIGSSSLSINGPADVLTVMFREGLSALSVEPLLSGIRLSFTGAAGQSYSIQRASVVNGPWNTINAQSAPASGLIEYIDAKPPVGAAFYRTSEP